MSNITNNILSVCLGFAVDAEVVGDPPRSPWDIHHVLYPAGQVSWSLGVEKKKHPPFI